MLSQSDSNKFNFADHDVEDVHEVAIRIKQNCVPSVFLVYRFVNNLWWYIDEPVWQKLSAWHQYGLADY